MATTKRTTGVQSRRGDRLDERGSATAELVIATPLLLLLILGIVQFAVWEHAVHVAQATAQQGLAAGRIQGGTEQAATTQANSVLTQLGSGVLVHPNVSATRGAITTTVEVTGQAEGILPFLSLPVRAVASGPTERFTTEAGP
jgi:Flp pilus assembly protein TadG